jgi:hypothetical protein
VCQIKQGTTISESGPPRGASSSRAKRVLVSKKDCQNEMDYDKSILIKKQINYLGEKDGKTTP